jgi:hypothetical protein
VRVLASELWWAALVVGGAQGVRLGASPWVVLPSAYIVDIALVRQIQPDRPAWLWFLNALAIAGALHLARGVSVLESMRDVPRDPPAVPPTPAQREMAAGLERAGFVAVADTAALVGDPGIHLWVLARDDGTVAELVHAEPHGPGFGFRTQLDPPAPGYDTIESVPWKHGWPAATTRRIALPKASWSTLLDAHDAALAEAIAGGARPVPVRLEEALANVLASDRATAARALARPWRSMARANGIGRRRR